MKKKIISKNLKVFTLEPNNIIDYKTTNKFIND